LWAFMISSTTPVLINTQHLGKLYCFDAVPGQALSNFQSSMKLRRFSLD
jgi:hypothetical protein